MFHLEGATESLSTKLSSWEGLCKGPSNELEQDWICSTNLASYHLIEILNEYKQKT